MSDTLLYILLAIAVLVILIMLLRSSGTKRDNGGNGGSTEEGHGVSDGLAAALEDVVGELTGVEAHPANFATDRTEGSPDTLTQIKGLGPRAAATLNAIGITRFDQIAGWTPDDLATVGAKLGNRTERIRRDRWAEQARLLARGEIAAFEAKFGKLG